MTWPRSHMEFAALSQPGLLVQTTLISTLDLPTRIPHNSCWARPRAGPGSRKMRALEPGGLSGWWRERAGAESDRQPT